MGGGTEEGAIIAPFCWCGAKAWTQVPKAGCMARS